MTVPKPLLKQSNFASPASLTDDQMLEEWAMLVMVTEEFCDQAAQENGIWDMTTVHETRKLVVNDLDEELLAADYQI